MTVLSSCLLRKQIEEQSPLCPPHQTAGKKPRDTESLFSTKADQM